MTIVLLFKIVIKISQFFCFTTDRIKIPLLLLSPKSQRCDKAGQTA